MQWTLKQALDAIAKGELPLDGQSSNGFFIPRDLCLDCGICHETTDGIISEGAHLVSAFQRQPLGTRELWSVYRAARECMADCIYYGGSDPEIHRNMEHARQGTKDFDGEPE